MVGQEVRVKAAAGLSRGMPGLAAMVMILGRRICLLTNRHNPLVILGGSIG